MTPRTKDVSKFEDNRRVKRLNYFTVFPTGSSHIVTPTSLLDDIQALTKAPTNAPMETFTIVVEDTKV